MKTNLQQQRQEVSEVVRKCVHCGLCTATCPTYLLLKDERDSPRGRIYTIKSMLDEQRAPSAKEIVHIDRCLVCLGCTSTCPSGVDYHSLIHKGKNYIDKFRPFHQKVIRYAIARTFSHPILARLLFFIAYASAPLIKVLPFVSSYADLLPKWDIHRLDTDRAGIFKTKASKRGQVLLHRGCVQSVIGGHIHDRTLKLMLAQGFDVVVPPAMCCGSLGYHMGSDRYNDMERTLHNWVESEKIHGSFDAIIHTASGCTSTTKQYGHILKSHACSSTAHDFEKKVMDIVEFWQHFPLRGEPIHDFEGVHIAYHAACSYQHGQKKGNHVPAYLQEKTRASYSKPDKAHLCCGSAGVYNILQPKIASELQQQKQASLLQTKADIVVTSNIGCMVQLSAKDHGVRICHISELLAFAYLKLPFHSFAGSLGESREG